MYPTRTVTSLDLDSLPRRTLSRLWVELTEDGLGRPVCAPVLVARGAKRGPVFGLTAALHGNELNGIPVIHTLLRKLSLEKLKGTVVGVVVSNPLAFLKEQRRLDEGIDPNHIMPGQAGGTTAQVYAHRLLERIVRKFDFLVDLHTASFGRVNCLYIRADMKQDVTATMAYLQRPQIILHNPASDHTLRGTAMEMGVPAITVEIGDPHLFQYNYVRRSYSGIRALLSEHKMLPRRQLAPVPPPVICSRSQWLYTEHGGFLEVFPKVAQVVEVDEVVARMTNVFGDILCEYRSPERGIVIGKSVNPVAQTGSRILHLGHIETESDFVLPVSSPVAKPGVFE